MGVTNQQVRVAPRPGGGLSSASTRHRTQFGIVAVQWQRDGEQLTVEVTLPVGVTAAVDLPGLQTEVGHGHHTFTTRYRAAADDPSRPPALSKFMQAIAEVRQETGAILA